MALFFLKSTLLFLYVFNIKFIGAEFYSTLKFALLLGLILYGSKSIKKLCNEIEKNPIIYMAFAFVLIWASIVSIAGSANSKVVFTVINLFILSIFSTFIFFYAFQSRIDFLKSFLLIVNVQAFFVFLSFFNPDFRQFTSEILVSTSNININNAARVAGFTNSTGSALSFTFALGVFAAMYLALHTQNFKLRALYFISSFFIISSTLAIGKLGFYLSVGFVFITLLMISIHSKNGFFQSIGLVFLLSCISLISISFLDMEGQTEYIFRRTFALFVSGEDKTIKALTEMPIPELNIDTIIGHGGLDIFGQTNAANSDSGYIRTYFSLGLVFSIILYLTIFFYIFKKISQETVKSSFFMLLILLICLFITEIKEPFIFKVNFVFFVLLVTLLADETSDISKRLIARGKDGS